MAYELDIQAVLLCSGVLAFLPITTWSLWLLGQMVMRHLHLRTSVKSSTHKCKQHDNMQRGGTKSGHNNSNNGGNIKQQQSNRVQHGKNDTNASGQQQQLSTSNINNPSQQSTPNHSNRARKSRNNNNSINNNNNNGYQSSPGKKQAQHAQDTERKQGRYKVKDWLETHCHVSTTTEDNLVSCHHGEVHRNSTSSEITCSDDLNSCSSNEDLEMQKKSNKPARQANNQQNKRQSKRKQNSANKNNIGNVQQQKLPVQQQNVMDVDDSEEGKENQIPITLNNNSHNGRNSMNRNRTMNTRISVNKNEPNLAKINSNSNGSTHSVHSSTSSSNSTNSSPTASPTAQKRSVEQIRKIVRALVPKYLQASMSGLGMTETQFYMALQRHLVPKNLLRVYGYPVESVFHDGCVEIFKLMPRGNVNAKRGIVNMCDDLLTRRPVQNVAPLLQQNDSGKGSSDISPPDLDCEIVEDEPVNPITGFQPEENYQIFSQYDQSLEKKCVRCKAKFHVTEGGQYVTREECVFHWGKKYQIFNGQQRMVSVYSCCNQENDAMGCARNKLHVWNGAVMGINGPYTDFVYTYERYNEDGTIRRSHKVYALDCEMSYTAHGLDLTKVTLIDADGNIIYEKFVIPAAEIADYNTRFSGITAEDLCPKSNISLKTLPEVQRDLLEIISADSILIGHGLDNDLRALRMVHKTIVDTSVTYPHQSGFPYRLSLKHLARSYLGRLIQTSGVGHSSFEDSLAALHLMYVKVQADHENVKVSE